MLQCEIKTSEINRPASLSAIEITRRHEVLQVLVVSTNVDRVIRTFEEMTPFFKCANNSEHFLVVNLVIPFYRAQSTRVKSNWMPLIIFRGLLRQNCTSGKIGTVAF